MSESTGVAFGFVKFLHDFKSGRIYFFYDHLGDAVSASKRVWLSAQIDCRDLYFPAVIGIDGSGRINQSDTVFYRQSAARSNLGFKSFRKRDGNPSLLIVRSCSAAAGCLNPYPDAGAQF
jgi:hypothetical protein